MKLQSLLPIALTATTTAAQTLNFVAHEDDDLLFLSPDLLTQIQSGRSVRTVFLTAGDAGNGPEYWTMRQEGSRAAYASMSNAANSWTQSDAGVDGYNIPVFTLDSNPDISLAFLQLPDGNIGGEGFNGAGSLKQLWEGTVASLTSWAGSTYTKDGLIEVLRQLGDAYEHDSINTHDFVHSYGDGDHSDHYTTGYLVKEAFGDCERGEDITSYMGYPVENMPVNLDESTLEQKKAVFYTYASYDRNTCASDEACSGRSEELWVQRQYVVGELDQTTCEIKIGDKEVEKKEKQAEESITVLPATSPIISRPVIPTPTRGVAAAVSSLAVPSETPAVPTDAISSSLVH
ncbi:hypothetical protein BJX61DRAFT_550940 [Aspergillus egyptiacus]|nr:hypothetical protein BJX61DRAFT_550940 [Aspergillus egyptiacus]